MKVALALIGCKFHKSSFDSVKIQMVQSECLYTGAINKMAMGIQVIQAGMGSGVFP